MMSIFLPPFFLVFFANMFYLIVHENAWFCQHRIILNAIILDLEEKRDPILFYVCIVIFGENAWLGWLVLMRGTIVNAMNDFRS